MTWLITDTQLAELHQKFHTDEFSSVDYILDVAKEMNISAEVVHNWFEHMSSTYMSQSNAMCRQRFGERKYV